MKTPRLFRLALGCVALAASIYLAPGTRAAGFISVPAVGVGPLTFDNVANPPPTNGFSTQNILGAGNSVNDPAAMDLAVPTNEVANITALLPQSASIPPTTINPSFARYNTAGTWLQMRPTGNAYNVLLATFRNESGLDRNSIILTYDQGLL
jgi:hypothetical protein